MMTGSSHKSAAQKNTAQKGFTLVELAISLSVIGLLLAGLLKATELLENSRVNAVVTQSGYYEAAIIAFQRTYDALPGDMYDPSRLNCGSVAYCNVAGNGDARIFDSAASVTAGGVLNGESRRVWIQLARSGLITTIDAENDGTVTRTGGIDYPATPFKGGVYDVHHYGSSHYLRMRPEGAALTDPAAHLLPYRVAQKIDVKMDDGLPRSGRVLSRNNDGVQSMLCREPGDGTNGYYFSSARRHYKCDIWIEMNF